MGHVSLHYADWSGVLPGQWARRLSAPLLIREVGLKTALDRAEMALQLLATLCGSDLSGGRLYGLRGGGYFGRVDSPIRRPFAPVRQVACCHQEYEGLRDRPGRVPADPRGPLAGARAHQVARVATCTAVGKTLDDVTAVTAALGKARHKGWKPLEQ